MSWTSTNGSTVTWNRTLPIAYHNGDIPSISYGLHVGSATKSIPGSLVLGGYDRSRCLTDPIQSSGQDFTLVGIDLGVASGASPFNTSAESLLRINGSSVDQLTTYPNPGVPYLYLPSDTCEAIAARLPVTFDANLGLYLWDISSPSFYKILVSPSYLSFSFASRAGQNSTIYVPLALLNLTLDNPLVSTPTLYFPCSPYTPSDGSTFHLGRAFLQAATLAQNWQTGSLLLSQAPGPDLAAQDIKTIASTDATITPMINAPSWDTTWGSVLQAIPGNSTASATASPTALSSSHSNGLSGGAIAGIIIGVIAVILILTYLAVMFLRHRKRAALSRTTNSAYWDAEIAPAAVAAYHKEEPPKHEKEGNILAEAPMNDRSEIGSSGAKQSLGESNPVEMDGRTNKAPGELEGDTRW